MKCIVLAGGTGDRLWPISRRNFPKQFVKIINDRSIFQETILRNVPFCDEFIVVTNTSYANIVKNQLSAFQDLKYRIILEPVPLKGTAAIITSCLDLDPEEDVLLTSCDYLIHKNYNSNIVAAKAKLKDNEVLTLTVKPQDKNKKYVFLRKIGGIVTFQNSYSKGSYWMCGISLFKAKTVLEAIKPDYIEKCKKIKIIDNVINAENEDEIALKLEDVLDFKRLNTFLCNFKWTKIKDLSSLYEINKEFKLEQSNVISKKSDTVEVLNTDPSQLVVLNDLKNLIVVNTKDALFISSIKKEWDIKGIGKKAEDQQKYFDSKPIIYFSWGTSERIDKTAHAKINKLTINPGASFNIRGRYGNITNYIVSGGQIVHEVNGKSTTYKINDTFSLGSRAGLSTLKNLTSKEVRLIQIVNRLKDDEENALENSFLLKMKPFYQDIIWGGTKIRDVLGKDAFGFDRIAESWELSAHRVGQSRIDNGKYRGLKFDKFVKDVGRSELGWKATTYERFPLLIKFIDAKQNLSIQVHPHDEYAFNNEDDFGKNEMWYIMDADEGSYIYYGFNKEVTREEVEERIKSNTITEILNKIYVKPGDSFFIDAGTVHAIGAGCLICEVQQSSNVTYRMYDYGRLDKDGKPRELHIKKSLDVISYKKKEIAATSSNVEETEDYTKKNLATCKYFVVNKYEIKKKILLPPNDASFKAVVVVDGEGTISNGKSTYSTFKGDTWFAGCNEAIEIEGDLTVLVNNI